MAEATALSTPGRAPGETLPRGGLFVALRVGRPIRQERHGRPVPHFSEDRDRRRPYFRHGALQSFDHHGACGGRVVPFAQSGQHADLADRRESGNIASRISR